MRIERDAAQPPSIRDDHEAEPAVPRADSVQVHIRCRVCRRITRTCVGLEHDVPHGLRCASTETPSPAQEIRCANCGRLCFENIHEVSAAVGDAVRDGWQLHLRQGAVVLDR
ncbi:MAG: hypothetical protein M3238_07065 [Actinomycetota bacterium]|nr:hypothetical protein [Actinomycetota bacterium]